MTNSEDFIEIKVKLPFDSVVYLIDAFEKEHYKVDYERVIEQLVRGFHFAGFVSFLNALKAPKRLSEEDLRMFFDQFFQYAWVFSQLIRDVFSQLGVLRGYSLEDCGWNDKFNGIYLYFIDGGVGSLYPHINAVYLHISKGYFWYDIDSYIDLTENSLVKHRDPEDIVNAINKAFEKVESYSKFFRVLDYTEDYSLEVEREDNERLTVTFYALSDRLEFLPPFKIVEQMLKRIYKLAKIEK